MWSIFRKHKVGLVLGGGGARGFFHVGVIKGLQELKVRVDEITGTSIGAVVGAMWAANPALDIEKTAKEVDFLKIIHLMIWGSARKNTEEVSKYLKQFVRAERFEDLKIKLKFTATDINNQAEVVFDKGDLFPGLIASISVPGIFPPIACQGRYLVDGGLMDNVPASLISKASSLIVSDICGPIKKVDGNSLGIDVLYSSIALMQQKNSLEKMKLLTDKKITYLHLEDNATFILDFRKQNFQKLIDLGYSAVMAHQQQIRSTR